LLRCLERPYLLSNEFELTADYRFTGADCGMSATSDDAREV
jgi:hypothetical protein